MTVTRPRLTRGSSGASVDVHVHHALKTGDPRVSEQGRWLQQHPMPLLPAVFEVRADTAEDDYAYRMERLWDINRRDRFGDELLHRLFNELGLHIWNEPPEVTFGEGAHVLKIAKLSDAYLSRRHQQDLVGAFLAIKWDDLPRCLAHGDPTLDNLMLRLDPNRRPARTTYPVEEGQLVLIDPLPPTPAVPSLRCVDVGKLLQSVYGYERARYGDPGFGGVTFAGVDQLLGALQDANERYAARYWHAVHLLRCLPYAEEVVAYRLHMQLREALSRL